MSEGNGDRPISPFGQGLDTHGLAQDLTGYDRKVSGDDKDKALLRFTYVTLTVFPKESTAVAYADTMARFIEKGWWQKLNQLILRCMALVSVKGRGRDDIIDVLTQFQAEVREREKADERKSARKPQRATV